MKILMLSWEYPPRIVGGIARVVGELSKRLAMEGHDVTVVTYREENMPYYMKEESGVKVYCVDNYMIRPNNFIEWIMQLNFNMAAKVNELVLKGEKFDVIHAHDWLVAYAAKSIKESTKIPMIATIHATESGRKSGINTETQMLYQMEQILINLMELLETIILEEIMLKTMKKLYLLLEDWYMKKEFTTYYMQCLRLSKTIMM